MSEECPICFSFQSNDPAELEQHVDACLTSADEKLARELANEDSLLAGTQEESNVAATTDDMLIDFENDMLHVPSDDNRDQVPKDDNSSSDDEDHNNRHGHEIAKPLPDSPSPELSADPVADDSDTSDEEQTFAKLAQQEAQRRHEQEKADEELAKKLMSADNAEANARKAKNENTSLACVHCGKTDLGSDAVMLDACLHLYCRVCIVDALTSACRTWRSGDPDPGCVECFSPVRRTELRALLSAEIFDEFENRQARSALTDSTYATCPNDDCGNIMERLPASASERAQAGTPAELHRLEYRMRCRECSTNFCSQCRQIPYHKGYTCETFEKFQKSRHCRFCDSAIKDAPKINNDDDPDLLAVRDVCSDELCQKAAETVCRRRLDCDHWCCGVRDEKNCLRCLYCERDDDAEAKEQNEVADNQNGEDLCNICWTDSLTAGPCLQLKCRHIFHQHCLRDQLAKRWPSPCISFQFADCPLCKKEIEHEELDDLLNPIRELQKAVIKKAVLRLKVEGMMKEMEASIASGKFEKPEGYAMSKMAFYLCFKCKKSYFGGLKECNGGLNAENVRDFQVSDLVCGACCGAVEKCDRHGTDYIEWKCRFCCSLATFFCGSKAHFCTPCHSKPGQYVEFSKWTTLPNAPMTKCAGPSKCPLGGVHKPNGVESALGCAMCRAESSLGEAIEQNSDDDSQSGDEDKGESKRHHKRRRRSRSKKGNGGVLGFLGRAFAK